MLLVAGQIAGLAKRYSTREWQDLVLTMEMAAGFDYLPVIQAVSTLRNLLDEKPA